MKDPVKIIENAVVFTGDKQHRAGKMNLVIQKGIIAEIGNPEQVQKFMHSSTEVIDASNKVILPGFVDSHHSGESVFLRNLTAGQPLEKWNKNSALIKADEYLRTEASYEDFLTIYRHSYFSALKSGITTISEYGFDTPEHSFSASVEAMRQANLRGIIGLHNSDQIETAKRIQGSLIKFACALSKEENLTVYNFQSTIRTAHELQWPVMAHLGQTQHGCDVIKKNFNKSIMQLYSDYRLFENPVHLLHLTNLDDSDVEKISKLGIPLILAPASIIRKKTNLPPFEKLFRRNVSIALGSDWESARPLENIQSYSALLQTFDLHLQDGNELLSLQTRNGAKALGMENEIGSIEAGKKADLVFLDISGFQMNALLADNNTDRMLNVILLEASSHLVSDVMINGEFYVRKGHLLAYSEDDLAREGRETYKKILEKIGQYKSPENKSAPVLQLTVKQKKKDIPHIIEMPYEEGFSIVQKNKTHSGTKNEIDNLPGKSGKPNKIINKIFGEDDI